MPTSKEEMLYANNTHLAWLRESTTKEALDRLRMFRLPPADLVTGADGKEAFYAQALRFSGIQVALVLLESVPFPQIKE